MNGFTLVKLAIAPIVTVLSGDVSNMRQCILDLRAVTDACRSVA